VGPITDGVLSIGDRRLDNTIPDRIQTSGEVTLECAVADGAFTVRGETLEILPTSSPRYVEALPDSLRPPDLSASCGMPVWALPAETTSGLPLLELPSGGYWQFATSTLNFPNPMARSDVVVLFATGHQFAADRRIATDALTRTYPRSTVVIVDEHRSGRVRVTCDDFADNFIVAAATAIAAASGAWDEANPIVVAVGDEDVPITTRVVDNLWRASLWNRAG
jgi:hypothetical protein